MGLDMSKLWDFLYQILNVSDEFVEDKVELVYGGISSFFDGLIADKDSKFGKKGKEIIELGIRDRLIKKYSLEDFPLD